jgi:hypothetical protein
MQLVGISLILLSIYLATIRDITDPVLAFIRAYSRINGDAFQYFSVLFFISFKLSSFFYRLKIILGLIAIGALYIAAVIAFFSGLIGHSTMVTIIVNINSFKF